MICLQDGVYERIENFLQRNRTEYVVSIDVKDRKTGNTPLIWAAKRGHAKVGIKPCCFPSLCYRLVLVQLFCYLVKVTMNFLTFTVGSI